MSFKIAKIEKRKQDFSWPDIDNDFSINVDDFSDGREEVINELTRKYGKEHVAYIGNRLMYLPKSAIRDLGQIYDIPSSETQKATKYFNEEWTLEQNMERNKDIKEYFTKYKELKTLVPQICGVTSALGVHAGGVVISDSKYPLTRNLGLQRPGEGGRIATIWTKDEIAQLGYIKYDILGLSSAGQIALCKKLRGENIYENYQFDIEEVYQNTVLKGHNKNIFQFESALGKRCFSDLLPMSIEELANASGLIRILGTDSGRRVYNSYKDNVIDLQTNGRKQEAPLWKSKLKDEIHDKERNYEIVEQVLGSTYGILIYQEQLCELIKGISRGEKTFVDGNNVRKYLGRLAKKHGYIDDLQGKREDLQKWHADFMKIMNEYVLPYIGKDGWNCPDLSVRNFLEFNLAPGDKLEVPQSGIISWMVTSSVYIFSRLHSVSYSINTYEQLYQKTYDPFNFWLSVLMMDAGNLDDIEAVATAIRSETSIEILPPNINNSNYHFKKEGENIRYGLGSIMSLTKAAIAIVEERIANGNYTSIEDFLKRIPGRIVNSRVLTNLLMTGAFSDFGDLETVKEEINKKKGMDFKDIDFSTNALMKKEYELLGTNITYIDPLLKKAKQYTSLTDIDEGSNKMMVKVTKTTLKKTKTGKDYLFHMVEDMNSRTTFSLFNWNKKELELGRACIVNVFKKGDFLSIAQEHSNNFKRRY